MILTKDNLLRFVREKKAVTPTMVGEAFETTTMIASAALSELAKEKLILITHLKLSSSPYYYDPKQREYLVELGLNHYSKYEKEVLIKLKEREILADNSLTIQEKLAIEKIKDFAFPIEVDNQGNPMKFWVWYLRNPELTKQQIIEALSGNDKPKTSNQNTSVKKEEIVKPKIVKEEIKTEIKASEPIRDLTKYPSQENEKNENNSKPKIEIKEDDKETFIENYLKENYFKVESKQKDEKGILYQASLNLSKIKIEVDCYYFYKKTTEADLIKFYTSSQKPKIIFIVNCPKKLFKFAESIDNLTIVNI